ncbi:MAG TPA: thioredoxin domain-containing protein [Blastocatellia bacterium]
MKSFSPFLIALALTLSAFAQQKPADIVGNKKDVDCGCEWRALPDPLATVNGVKVDLKEINDALKDRIADARAQLDEARNRELERQVAMRLIEAEAKKRGITAAKLIEQDVISKMSPPTEGEALSFYEQNKDRLQGPYSSFRSDILNYLRDQMREEGIKKLAQRLRAKADVKILVQKVTPPANEADRKRVLATVAGAPVTSGDIEDALRPLIFNAEEQLYELRKEAIDIKINSILFQKETEKRKVSANDLFQAEIAAKMKPVSEEDARTFYEQNRSQINGEYEQVKAQIFQHLTQVEQNRRETEYVSELRKPADIKIFLTPPDPPKYDIAIDDQPVKGNASALVTIVEFTDFECPSCGALQPVIEEVMKEYGDRVKLVVRDFPLGQHQHASKAAEAAEAAREQGRYWEYIAVLFQNQKALAVENLKEYASTLGLDRAKFDEALDSGKFKEKVQRDIQDGTRIGINSTPTIFINGRQVRDKSIENLKAALEAALKETKK